MSIDLSSYSMLINVQLKIQPIKFHLVRILIRVVRVFRYISPVW